jgi:hypothetical protein
MLARVGKGAELKIECIAAKFRKIAGRVNFTKVLSEILQSVLIFQMLDDSIPKNEVS